MLCYMVINFVAVIRFLVRFVKEMEKLSVWGMRFKLERLIWRLLVYGLVLLVRMDEFFEVGFGLIIEFWGM